MSGRPDGGGAFPVQFDDHTGQTAPYYDYGMSMRQWYKGMALKGYLAATPHDQDWPKPDEAARRAAEYADAMLVEDTEHAKKEVAP